MNGTRATLPTWALERLGALGPTGFAAVAVLAVLCAFKDDRTGRVFPSVATLARSLSTSDRTVRAALRVLEEHQIIRAALVTPGKPTAYEVVMTAPDPGSPLPTTPEAGFRPPRKPTSEVPRKLASTTPEAGFRQSNYTDRHSLTSFESASRAHEAGPAAVAAVEAPAFDDPAHVAAFRRIADALPPADARRFAKLVAQAAGPAGVMANKGPGRRFHARPIPLPLLGAALVAWELAPPPAGERKADSPHAGDLCHFAALATAGASAARTDAPGAADCDPLEAQRRADLLALRLRNAERTRFGDRPEPEPAWAPELVAKHAAWFAAQGAAA